MNTQLCKGFMVSAYASDDQHEHHYAVLPSGAVFTCAVAAPTPNFGRDSHGRAAQWSPQPALPASAQFIGNYPIPSNLR